MEKVKARILNAWPYQQDKMNMPVESIDKALPFYQTMLGFHQVSRKEEPYSLAILQRGEMQIGLAENGGDPTQDGCFFEVDDLAAAYEEFKSNGLEKELSAFSFQKHGDTNWQVFFVIAPDGLCFCFGERQG
jgi:catechol 2,3-dioxygenase-like lactoylglutathione lyase family enzyme